MSDNIETIIPVIFEDIAGDGVTMVNGQPYMFDAKGNLVPLANIRDEDMLQDQTVRKIMAYAVDLNGRVERFRDHTMVDLGTFDALLAEQYGAKIGGAKGNRTYQTIDGLMKVQVQVSDMVSFGPELQVAKRLVDECIIEWSADSRAEMQTLISGAFDTDKEGQINKSNLYMLLNRKITDERWVRAMDAIRASIRVTGSKEYVRFYRRERRTDGWQAVTIDLAKAGVK